MGCTATCLAAAQPLPLCNLVDQHPIRGGILRHAISTRPQRVLDLALIGAAARVHDQRKILDPANHVPRLEVSKYAPFCRAAIGVAGCFTMR